MLTRSRSDARTPSVARALALALAASGAGGLAPLRAQREFAEVTALQLPPELRLRGVLEGDFDGEGTADLAVLAVTKGDLPIRRLRMHFRRAEASPFRNAPDAEIDVPEDVVAWASGDVHADTGEEVVLFAAGGVYALRPRASEAERFAELFACDFLWQIAQPRRLHAWQRGVLDLDRDGDLDLYVPEPNGYRLAFQERTSSSASFVRGARLELPLEARAVQEKRGVRSTRTSGRIRFSGVDRSMFGSSPLLELRTSLPTPTFADFDGDGDLDAIAQTERHVHVWTHDAAAWRASQEGAGIAPSLRYDAPVPMDESRRADWFYSTRVKDLDRDGRADAVLISGDLKSEDFRSIAQIFVNGRGSGAAAKSPEAPLFGPRGYPDQVLAISGFLANPTLTDVDGDGHDDFTLLSMRFDVTDAMRTSGSLDIELFVFLGKQGTFSREPNLVHRFTVKAETMRGGRSNLELRFCGDLTGDGVQEMIARDREDHLAVFWVRSRRGALELLEQPLWELTLADDAEITRLERPGRRTELAILEEGELRHVRFP